MKLGIMRFLLLVACFGVAQTYFSEQTIIPWLTFGVQFAGNVLHICSAAYAILIYHVFGLLYLSQLFCFKIFAVVQ